MDWSRECTNSCNVRKPTFNCKVGAFFSTISKRNLHLQCISQKRRWRLRRRRKDGRTAKKRLGEGTLPLGADLPSSGCHPSIHLSIHPSSLCHLWMNSSKQNSSVKLISLGAFSTINFSTMNASVFKATVSCHCDPNEKS